MNETSKLQTSAQRQTAWYDLFSRGARDWLRHNKKVRDAVKDQLTELISQANIVNDDGQKRVQVPVKFLEHFRFKLNEQAEHEGAGQGDAKPGDVVRQDRGGKGAGADNQGGNSGGGVEFVLELAVDDIVDWLWEELSLPNLVRKTGVMEHEDFNREGWNRRGVRSRLDRRRSLKESIKRRHIQSDGPAIVDDDLRFRQLVRREQPSCNAVVFFVMDVSASMSERDRRLAKTFFFWVVQGLRRQYVHLDCEFVAHTDRAWQFSEQEFFQVKGSGGTVASTALELVNKTIAEQYDPCAYNIYIFYASDGDNFPNDRQAATKLLDDTMQIANFGGFVEISAQSSSDHESEMASVFSELKARKLPVASYSLHEEGGVWDAIKAFFVQASEHFQQGG